LVEAVWNPRVLRPNDRKFYHTHSHHRITITGTESISWCQKSLLRAEVKVESCLESVELEVTGREKSWSSGGGSHVEGWLDWSLNWGLSDGSSCWLGSELNSGLVSGEETSLLVGSIEWVDEGVDSGAVGTGRNSEVAGGSGSGLGGKLGSVGVESEVTVGWVMGVDEWVEVGVNWLISVVVVDGLGNWGWGSLDNWGSLLNWGSNWSSWGLGNERSGVLSVST